MHQEKPSSRALLAGLVGGIAGLVVMGWAMQGSKRALPEPKEHDSETQPDGEISLVGKHHREGEPSTGALGRIAYTRVTGHEPSEKTEQKLSNAVHWGYGLSVASLYAVARPERMPGWQSGLLFGLGLWVFGDELAVPLLGLSTGPQAHPWQTHASTLAAHLAFGATTGVVTDALEKRL